LSKHLVEPAVQEPEHLQVAGLLKLAQAITTAGEQFAEPLGMLDYWQDQRLISLAANALVFAIRLDDPAMKQWCFELSCAALSRYCESKDLATPSGAPRAWP
jgi:hypothetical protein